MKNRLIFKTDRNALVSVPAEKVYKTLGDNVISTMEDKNLYWIIHHDYVSIVDKQLFPEEDLI